jgi:hypothetical protein
MDRPSWVGDAGGDVRPRRDAADRPPLLALVGLGSLAVVVAEAVGVLGRDDLRLVLRVVLAVLLALQLAAVELTLRRSSAAAMVLLLCLGTGVAASLAAGHVAVAALAAVTLALLVKSFRWFPGYQP